VIFTAPLRNALQFCISVHEVNQKQKRKGKDIPYVTHPLSVALILARSGGEEELLIAGLLHDTVEDSSPEFPVTFAMLDERFGPNVASLVESVTEPPKTHAWHDRKHDALQRISDYSRDSVLLKSADVIANDWELIGDFADGGDSVFSRFKVSKSERLHHQHQVIEALIYQWPDSPLVEDLRCVAGGLRSMEENDPSSRSLTS
jgi:(p)ppGpp synthase/HD superfamily hydrolase